jgi:phospholipase C
VIEFGDLSFGTVESTPFTLSVGAGPMPPDAKAGSGNAMFIQARVQFPRVEAEIHVPVVPNPVVEKNAVRFDLRLYLTVEVNGLLGFFPVFDSNLLDGVDPDVKSEISSKIGTKLGEVVPFGPFLTPWLTGGRFRLATLAYEPGAGDQLRPDGIVERATGTLVVRYVGPRAAPQTQPVLDGGFGTTPAPDDGIPKLFDLPDEDPDPVPRPPGGGGVDPQPPGGRPKLGALGKVERIVVLMQENRSFDQVLGYLKRDGIDPRVEGLDPDPDAHSNSFNGKKILSRRADPNDPPRRAATDWPSLALIGPGHDSDDVLSQMSGDMGGFVENYARRLGLEQPKGPLAKNLRLVMDHFGPDQLRVYAELARAFGICDHWYTAHPGPTWPNRFVTATGDLNRDRGQVELDNPSLRTFVPVAQKTLFDHLNDHGVPWRVYEHGFSFIRLFANFTFDTDNVLPFDDEGRGFEVAARTGTLPPVTFIEPDYIEAPPGNDDHPPADMANGQELVARIVKALIASPAFERTLLVITYDEHGGFFDHVQPPDDARPIGGGITKLGPRVPAFVISPMVPAGEVFHGRFDHTSIGATILRRFCGPRAPKTSDRMDASRDLREVLTLADSPRPRSEFADLDLPAVAPRPPRARSSASIGVPQGRDDFHFLLTAVRLIAGQPPRRTGLSRRAARFAPGELLVYRDATRDGSTPFAAPGMIGTGGWLQFRHLIAGGNGTLYAVDGQGRLLFYRDATQDGTGDVANPRVIGQGGWQAFGVLCSGGNGVLYGVDGAGRLLRYRDRNRDGTGDVANPVVVSAGGWGQHRFVVGGGDGHIYAIDAAGRLLFHRDSMRDAADAVGAPSVIGHSGWSAMRRVLSGGDGVLYAVDGGGRLLFFRDTTRDGSGEVAGPTVIESSGWSRFKHLTADGRGLVYAVPQ